MSSCSCARFLVLLCLSLFAFSAIASAQTSYGEPVASIHGQLGDIVGVIASATLPVSEAASEFLTEDERTGWGFVVVDPNTGIESPAQMRPLLYHHKSTGGVHQATPALAQIFFPVQSTSSGPQRLEVYSRPLSRISGPTSMSFSNEQLDFLTGVIEVRVPGPGWGWKADISVDQCDVVLTGPLVEKRKCQAKLQPDTNFSTQVPSGLSISVDLEFPRDKKYVFMSFLASNSNAETGSATVPFLRYTVRATQGGVGLKAYGHRYKFNGMAQHEQRHTIHSDGTIHFFPEISSPSSAVHAFPEDSILSSEEYLIDLDGGLGPMGQKLADVTRSFVPESQYGPGSNPDLMLNWLANSPYNGKVPNAREFYSQSELENLARAARTRILPISNNPTGGHPYTTYSPHAQWPFLYASMDKYGAAGGPGLQFVHEGNILAASGGHSEFRENLEAMKSHIRHQNNRQLVSFAHDAQGRTLKAEELVAIRNGVGINDGNFFDVHYASEFNPNRDLQQDSSVSTLRDVAINNAPYAREVIGYYYYDANQNLRYKDTRWRSTDRSHSLRYFAYGILGCLQVPTENCLSMLKIMGEVIYAFRTEGVRHSGNGNIWENNLRVALQSNAQGVRGSVIGSRANTDLGYATIGLQLRRDLGTFIPGRIALVSQILVEDMRGQNVITTTRKLDGRDFTRAQYIDIAHAAAAAYSRQVPQYWLGDDEAARNQFCQWVTRNGELVRECNFPSEYPYLGNVPSAALLKGLNDYWNQRNQSVWEGTYAANSIQHLIFRARRLAEISVYTSPAIETIQRHLHAFNNTCERGTSYKNCAFDENGMHQWIRWIGEPNNEVADETIFAHANSSLSATKYFDMGAIDMTINFESNPHEGNQTWMRVFPRIQPNRDTVLDQWTNEVVAWMQFFARGR